MNRDGRQDWIPVIEAIQKLNEKKSYMYICDLHFNRADIITNGKSVRPRPNVIPKLR